MYIVAGDSQDGGESESGSEIPCGVVELSLTALSDIHCLDLFTWEWNEIKLTGDKLDVALAVPSYRALVADVGCSPPVGCAPLSAVLV